jgi:short-subunit dehydrogenase
VLVTGASSGIGRATALALAAEGARLTLVARSEPSLREVAQHCRAAGATDVTYRSVDVSDAGAVAAVFAGTSYDGVVHAAAVMSYGRVEDTPADILSTLVDVNVTGAALVAREALRTFRRQGHGRLVLVSSVMAHLPVPLMGSYAMSKAAVSALGEVLRAETRRDPRVHVTGVTPGAVDTPLYDQAASVLGQEGRPPPPVMAPERVAAAVLDALRADRPAGSISVGAANTPLRLARTVAPTAFAALAEPAIRLLALAGPRRPSGGNVHAPVASREAVRGRWRGPLGRTTRRRDAAHQPGYLTG